MRDSIGTNVEEMDLHWGEGGGEEGEKLWISYTQLTYTAQVVKYQCQCQ